MKYPYKIELHKADFNQPNPDSKVSTHIVDARYDDEKGFFAIDLFNGDELNAYDSLDDASSESEKNSYYWVGEVLNKKDPRNRN